MNTNTIIYSILLLSILYYLIYDNSIIEHQKRNKCKPKLKRKCNRCGFKINDNCKEINETTCSKFITINNKLLDELKKKEYILEEDGNLIVNQNLVKKKIFKPDENSLDFGGFIGFGTQNPEGTQPRNKNPYTNQESCSMDYTRKNVHGTVHIDYPIDVCYKKWKDDKNYTRYMEFGGMYSSIPGREHPVTGEMKCPEDWDTHQIFGTSGVDNNIFYCYKIHNAKPDKFTPNAVEFGGVIGTVNNNTESALKNDNEKKCPPGFKTRYVMKKDDWKGVSKERDFAYCYKEIDDEFINKELDE